MTIVVCCYDPPGNFISGTIFYALRTTHLEQRFDKLRRDE